MVAQIVKKSMWLSRQEERGMGEIGRTNSVGVREEGVWGKGREYENKMRKELEMWMEKSGVEWGENSK